MNINNKRSIKKNHQEDQIQVKDSIVKNQDQSLDQYQRKRKRKKSIEFD